MAESPYKKRLDQFVWSFSRLNSYGNCPKEWKEHYIDELPSEGNCFAEFGSCCHSLYEDYAKGNLAEYEMGEEFDKRYPEYLKHDFPAFHDNAMAKDYYLRGSVAFWSFQGFPENWEIIAVEQRCDVKIFDRRFLGFIDLLVRNKDTGKLIVVDHKSKKKFYTQNELQHYAIQPYLYSKWVYETYGEYPEKLIFNLFKSGEMVEIPFDRDEYEAACLWVKETIAEIYKDQSFKDKIQIEYRKKHKLLRDFKHSDFYCNYLCGSRKRCRRSIAYEKECDKT